MARSMHWLWSGSVSSCLVAEAYQETEISAALRPHGSGRTLHFMYKWVLNNLMNVLLNCAE